MSTGPLTSLMSSMPIDDCKSSTSALATSTAPVAETNIGVEKPLEKRVTELAMKILNYGADWDLFSLLLNTSETLNNGLIMAGHGLQIFDSGSQLQVACRTSSTCKGNTYILKTLKAEEMIATIKGTVTTAQEKFQDDKSGMPVFDANLFTLALEGKDPTIRDFKKALVEYVDQNGFPPMPKPLSLIQQRYFEDNKDRVLFSQHRLEENVNKIRAELKNTNSPISY